MLAEDLGVPEKIVALDHAPEFRVGNEIITLPAGLGRAARPGGAGNGRHRSGQLQNFLHQRRLPRTGRSGHDQHQRCNLVRGGHSMFCTCSRSFSISARISSDKPVMSSASLSPPGVLQSLLFASRSIPFKSKSNFLPSSPPPSPTFATCSTSL